VGISYKKPYARNLHEVNSKKTSIFLYPEDGANMSSLTSAEIQRTTRKYITEDTNFPNHPCEILKSDTKVNVYRLHSFKLQ
jgi:hypothetical protein